ncbi:TIGR03986 family type III CRISPR-associated RAMP protein [Actinomyces sp. zg328]|uniref:TIGR03986 family type III CRISPR-associated RAMP protein n=1 Tax=Actinomyces sp. zg328 TaxID=2609287 RepID=UPI00135B60BA|nr:TIGR03986 family CRISPR-associated RAMP protein [Actinomyces sp. zg328]
MSSKNNTPKPGSPRRASKAPDPQSQPQTTPGTVPGPRNAQAFPNFKPFHSAVNRIPVLRTRSTNEAASGNLSPDLFADSPALGHDHLHPDRWSGSIDVEMTVRTPLVFGAQTEHDGKTYVNVPVDDADNPVIAPTMVKGMISRAYEALTCSRFRLFCGHDEPLTYRADPAMASPLIAGRITTGSDGQLALELLRGRHGDNDIGLIRDDPEKGLGTLILEGHPITLGPGQKEPSSQQVWIRFRNLLKHGQKVGVKLTPCNDCCIVTQVYNLSSKEFERFFSLTPEQDAKSFLAIGYVCRTAQDAHDNHPPSKALYADKHYERFFFSVSDSGKFSPEHRILTSSVLKAYERVINSYRSEHASLEGKPNQRVLNRASSGPEHLAPRDGDLVFVRLDDESGEVAEILPTMVGRRSYDRSPRELAEEQDVLPLAKAAEASPADRLFGYVVNSPEDGASGGDVAARGRIVVGPVDSTGALVSTKEKQLAPLLSPKPSSARRFLTDKDGLTPKETDEKPLRRDQYFTDGQLLGAAAYPVHRRLLEGEDLDSDGFPKQATTAASLGGQQQSNDSVRLTAGSWLASGSVLRCTVNFTNLSCDELGALVWVLTPENLVPPEERTTGEGTQSPVGYLRMGLGKPLGLGTIEVRIAKDGLRAVCGDDLAGLYARLDGCLGQEKCTYPLSHFPLPNEDTLREEPWVRALQRAAFGYTGEPPVRYMSLDENKKNNQTESGNQTDSGNRDPKPGRGLAPTDLCAEPPEPIDMGSAPQQGQRSQQRQRGQQGNHHKRR